MHAAVCAGVGRGDGAAARVRRRRSNGPAGADFGFGGVAPLAEQGGAAVDDDAGVDAVEVSTREERGAAMLLAPSGWRLKTRCNLALDADLRVRDACRRNDEAQRTVGERRRPVAACWIGTTGLRVVDEDLDAVDHFGRGSGLRRARFGRGDHHAMLADDRARHGGGDELEGKASLLVGLAEGARAGILRPFGDGLRGNAGACQGLIAVEDDPGHGRHVCRAAASHAREQESGER